LRAITCDPSEDGARTSPSSIVSTAEMLRPAGSATHLPRNRVAPTLTMQELLAAKAGRLMSV
jgi:hypothetical protein